MTTQPPASAPPMAAPAAADVVPPSLRRPRFDARYAAPVLISAILLGGHLTIGILESPWKTGLAIATAIGIEMVLGRIFVGRWPHLASAYVSGISVGILVRSPFFWPYGLCAAISVASKYVIRYRDRHIFNPSNFGIVVMLVLAPQAVASLSIQWDNRLWIIGIIWLLGFSILYRIRRLHISLMFIVSFVSLAAVRGLITGHGFLTEVAPITGPMYQLFTLFMVTDPRTTVGTRNGQLLVVFLVALVECVLRLLEAVHAPYYALFMVGPPALVFELWRQGRQSRPAVAPAV